MLFLGPHRVSICVMIMAFALYDGGGFVRALVSSTRGRDSRRCSENPFSAMISDSRRDTPRDRHPAGPSDPVGVRTGGLSGDPFLLLHGPSLFASDRGDRLQVLPHRRPARRASARHTPEAAGSPQDPLEAIRGVGATTRRPTRSTCRFQQEHPKELHLLPHRVQLDPLRPRPLSLGGRLGGGQDQRGRSRRRRPRIPLRPLRAAR